MAGKFWTGLGRLFRFGAGVDTIWGWSGPIIQAAFWAAITAMISWLLWATQGMTLAGAILVGSISAASLLAATHYGFLIHDRWKGRRRYGLDELKGWSVSAVFGPTVSFMNNQPPWGMIGFQGSRLSNLSGVQPRHVEFELHFRLKAPGAKEVILRASDAGRTEYRQSIDRMGHDAESRRMRHISNPLSLAPGAYAEGQLEFELDEVSAKQAQLAMELMQQGQDPALVIVMIDMRTGLSVELPWGKAYDAAVGKAVEPPPVRIGAGQTHTLATMRVPELGTKTVPPPEPLPVGSLHFVMLQPDLEIHRSAGKINVRLKAEIENATDRLIQYTIVGMRGEVNGKTVSDPDQPQIVNGIAYVYPHKRTYVMYERIDDVDLSTEVLSGRLEYLLKYTTVPPSEERTTGRTLVFETPISLEKHPVGTARPVVMNVTSLNQIEE